VRSTQKKNASKRKNSTAKKVLHWGPKVNLQKKNGPLPPAALRGGKVGVLVVTLKSVEKGKARNAPKGKKIGGEYIWKRNSEVKKDYRGKHLMRQGKGTVNKKSGA